MVQQSHQAACAVLSVVAVLGAAGTHGWSVYLPPVPSSLLALKICLFQGTCFRPCSKDQDTVAVTVLTAMICGDEGRHLTSGTRTHGLLKCRVPATVTAPQNPEISPGVSPSLVSGHNNQSAKLDTLGGPTEGWVRALGRDKELQERHHSAVLWS